MAAPHSAGPPAAGPPPAESLARLALGSLSSGLGSGRANSAPHSVFQYLPAGLEQVGMLAGSSGLCTGRCTFPPKISDVARVNQARFLRVKLR